MARKEETRISLHWRSFRQSTAACQFPVHLLSCFCPICPPFVP